MDSLRGFVGDGAVCESLCVKNGAVYVQGRQFNNILIYLFFGCAGSSLLRGFFSGCSEQVCSPSVVQGLLMTEASLAAERTGFGGCGSRAPEQQTQ